MHTILQPQNRGTIFHTGMCSLVLDCWALELLQFNIQFEHISGKKNVVADLISRQRLWAYTKTMTVTIWLKQMTIWLTTSWKRFVQFSGYQTWRNGEAQLRCIKGRTMAGHLLHKKVKMLRTKEDGSFVLDKNSILWKMVRLRYTTEPTIAVPRKLTCHIIVEFHSGKGHQGISHMVNVIRHYFWWVRMHRHTPAHQQLPVTYSIPT